MKRIGLQLRRNRCKADQPRAAPILAAAQAMTSAFPDQQDLCWVMVAAFPPSIWRLRLCPLMPLTNTDSLGLLPAAIRATLHTPAWAEHHIGG